MCIFHCSLKPRRWNFILMVSRVTSLVDGLNLTLNKLSSQIGLPTTLDSLYPLLYSVPHQVLHHEESPGYRRRSVRHGDGRHASKSSRSIWSDFGRCGRLLRCVAFVTPVWQIRIIIWYMWCHAGGQAFSISIDKDRQWVPHHLHSVYLFLWRSIAV